MNLEFSKILGYIISRHIGFSICVLWHHKPSSSSHMNHFPTFLPYFVLPIPVSMLMLQSKELISSSLKFPIFFYFPHVWLPFCTVVSLELRISVNWVVWCLVFSVSIYRKQTLGKSFMLWVLDNLSPFISWKLSMTKLRMKFKIFMRSKIIQFYSDTIFLLKVNPIIIYKPAYE